MLTYEQVPYLDPETIIAKIFAENPEPRCPCLLLLDVSSSMGGEPISELNRGLRTFIQELQEDRMAVKRVELAIVEFGPVQLVTDWTSADLCAPLQLEVKDNTPMGEAILKGLELLETRKQSYRDHSISYYRPWVFLITDGTPTDDWELAAQKVHQGEQQKKFSFYAVGVGNADLNVLNQISVRDPLRLKGLEFRKLFAWLSSSLGTHSRSALSQALELADPASTKGWVVIEGQP